MKLGTLLVIGLLVLAGVAQADVYSCDENGKKFFQDKPCIGQADVAPSIKTKPPAADPECRFGYTKLGGGKSKALAVNAKAECLRNKELVKAGQPDAVRLDAYTVWKDDREMRRAVANENQRRGEAVVKSFQAPRTMNCTPNMMRDGLECK